VEPWWRDEGAKVLIIYFKIYIQLQKIIYISYIVLISEVKEMRSEEEIRKRLEVFRKVLVMGSHNIPLKMQDELDLRMQELKWVLGEEDGT